MADNVKQQDQQAPAQQQGQRGPGQQPQGQPPRDEPKKRVNPRRKRTIRIVVLAIVVLAIIVTIPVYAYYSVRESTDDAQVDGHVVPISPRISGTIVSVLVNDNQPVRADQELVKLDPADYQVALDQAQASLLNSQATTSESQEN